MATTERTQVSGSIKRNSGTQYIEPKRLSKAGQWMLDNPGGIFIVKDRRAVNK